MKNCSVPTNGWIFRFAGAFVVVGLLEFSIYVWFYWAKVISHSKWIQSDTLVLATPLAVALLLDLLLIGGAIRLAGNTRSVWVASVMGAISSSGLALMFAMTYAFNRWGS